MSCAREIIAGLSDKKVITAPNEATPGRLNKGFIRGRNNFSSSFTTPKRLLLSFGITDEIYAVAVSQKGKISASYMAGLIIIPVIGWTSGTLVGAIASQLLPEVISNVMGILLYGMFIAVFVPAAKKSRPILTAVLMAIACSVIFKYCLPFVSSGFAIILSALISSAICAALFPIKEENNQ